MWWFKVLCLLFTNSELFFELLYDLISNTEVPKAKPVNRDIPRTIPPWASLLVERQSSTD